MAPETHTEEEVQAALEDGDVSDANLAMSDEDFLKLPEEEALAAMEVEAKAADEAAGKTPEELEADKVAAEAKAEEDEATAAAAQAEKDEEALLEQAELDEAAKKKTPETEEEETARMEAEAKAADAEEAKTDEEKAAEKLAADALAAKAKDDEVDPKAKKKVDKESEVDYKAEYLKLTAPFKANGTEMKVKNTEDAISLMQMGANYHKKMAGLKPSMKLLKLLENNELLDEGKLNFLIDLNNKDPKAITKLMKDGGIDPLDINVKDDLQYTVTDRKVDDKEIELDQVLLSIKDTPNYVDTLNVITKQWDDSSRAAAANEPQIISVINAQMADGTYKAVSEAVLYERSMGRLVGVSDLDAYKQMGRTLGEAKKLPFQQLAENKPAPAADVKKEIPSDKDAERKARKKKVATTKKVGGNETDLTYDPLDMSDEDFEKFDINSVPA